MKTTGTIIASVVGGAILGTALTCFLKSSKAAEIKSEAHKKIIHELKHLHAHMAGMCNCTENGQCSCNMDEMSGMSEMPAVQGDGQNNA